MFRPRRPGGRHRLGAPGLVWCRALPQVAAALDVPHIARRGFVERFLAGPRHLRPSVARSVAAPAPRAAVAA